MAAPEQIFAPVTYIQPQALLGSPADLQLNQTEAEEQDEDEAASDLVNITNPLVLPLLRLAPWPLNMFTSVGNIVHISVRSKRELTSVGEMSKSWFGIMSDSDREKINSMFREMRFKVDSLHTVAKAQTTLVNLTLDRLTTQETLLDRLKNLEAYDFQTMYKTVQSANDFSAIMRLVHAVIAQLRSEVKAFLTAYEFASIDGALSPAFIDASTFADLLKQLSNTLPLGLQLPVPAEPGKVEFYYRTARVTPVITAETLDLNIHIPLVLTTRKFRLYEAAAWPFKINESDLFVVYKPEAKYIAVGADLKSHILLNEADLQLCQSPDTPVCHPSVPFHTKPTCMFALLMSDEKEVARLCEPSFIKNPKPRFTSYRGGHTWAFSLPRPTKISLSDAQGRGLLSNLTKLPRTGLLHIPPFTSAEVDGLLLFSGSSFVSQLDFDDDVVIPDVSVPVPEAFALNTTNRQRIMQAINQLFNTSTQLGIEQGYRLAEIQKALNLPIWDRWTDYLDTYSIVGSVLTVVLLLVITVWLYWKCCRRRVAKAKVVVDTGADLPLIPRYTRPPHV
ncbi:uncharacterized protein LOC117642060 [Thrips palmi]|uniref:Uncharacterized protein LOC117642060 n=1 Tax=Thrips palmi TaxID=161013 RepID=A0A6P8YGS9_THRPL|nr:uncharacterized protein LOC117642060 [Thrips palmi]XP_034235757.1 uncharacterized protein LOC117642060 [Thrips palmi]